MAGLLEFLGDRCGLLKLTSVLFLLSKDDVDDVLREAASQLLAKGELGGALAVREDENLDQAEAVAEMVPKISALQNQAPD
ncbi:unnamed protein product [Durusdinium trenchii]|uniref:Uncharacterized protein n=1 Tax=Durusdinium trenchii TaxID=1381693 RepID=A0ABP0NCH0_9DINO